MFVIRKKLTPDEITPPTIRYNVDCDCIQTTFDGGTTWTDSPGSDPRSSPAFRAPPNSSADPQCNAAANMIALLQQLIAADLAADNAAALVVLWFSIVVTAFPFFGWIADLVLLVADGILAIGASAIDTAFTSAVYDDLLCVFLSHIDSDGQMSDAQLADIYTDIAAHFDLTVQAVFGLHSQSLGAVGWSNAGATGSETGDCSACVVPGCYEWNFVDACAQLGWGIYSGVFTGSPYCFFQQTCIGGVGSDSHVNPYIDWHTLGHIVISHLEIDLEIIGDISHWQMYRQQSADPGDIVLMAEDDVAVGVHTVTADFSDADWYGIDILVQTAAGCGSGDAYFKAVRIESPNLAPIGLSPNC